MRKGAILGLTWDMVDMTHGVIRLKRTKSGRTRAIPFNETLCTVFLEQQTQRLGPFVFHDFHGDRHVDVRKSFDRATAKAGLEDFHFHHLRHSFASALAMKTSQSPRSVIC